MSAASTNTVMPESRALNPLPAGTQPILRTGSEAVAYHIPIAPPTDATSPLKTTISLPCRSAWTSGLHFHVSHTEYLRLVKGSIFVQLDGVTKHISAASGGEVDVQTGRLVYEGLIVRVPRYTRHNWGRLEHYVKLNRHKDLGGMWPEDWTEEVVLEEWTDPCDISKPLFFWNLNGIVTAPNDKILSSRQNVVKAISGDWWIGLQILVVFWELDNWPVFVNIRDLWPAKRYGDWAVRVSDSIEMSASFIVLFAARFVGAIGGLRAVERNRTPDTLWEAYRKASLSLT